MKRVLYIALALFVALGVVRCSDDEETLLATQQTTILNFLTKTLKLISETEAQSESVQQDEPSFYTVLGDGAYRWIKTYYNESRRNMPVVRAGNRVELTLSVYTFSGQKITESTLPLYTNDEEKRSSLERAGLDLTYWTFEPYVVEVGAGDTIKGLELALVGCREMDEVELYMTFQMAYDRDWLATVPPDSAVAVFYTINKVE